MITFCTTSRQYLEIFLESAINRSRLVSEILVCDFNRRESEGEVVSTIQGIRIRHFPFPYRATIPSEGKFISTIGFVSAETIKKYIREQKERDEKDG